MARVFARSAGYDEADVRGFVFEALGSLLGDGCRPGCRVLIKPNFLCPAPPERAMLTHPRVLRAAAEFCLDRGADVLIADSPAMGTFERVMSEGGFREALDGLDVECRPFRETKTVDVGPPFHRIELATDALEADLVINLPKLKTHTQMLLTLGVKNLFGCVVGMRKPEWHFRAGIDRERFADVLFRVAAAVRPAATILDAILCMEGQGPGKGGTPKTLGMLMASDDAVALDIAVCRMLGLEPDRLFTTRAARTHGAVPEEIEVVGGLPEVRGFQLPEITPLVFGPKPLHRFMRRHLVQRPAADERLCRLCGACWRYCPARAIAPEKGGLCFDYDRCIRCYCCLEVCPHGALRAKETAIGRAARKMLKMP